MWCRIFLGIYMVKCLAKVIINFKYTLQISKSLSQHITAFSVFKQFSSLHDVLTRYIYLEIYKISTSKFH